jgi:hypothetical protein
MAAKSANQAGQFPGGRLTGMLAACTTTLIGVARDLDPLVVLFRAAIVGACCGVAVAVLVVAARWLHRTT